MGGTPIPAPLRGRYAPINCATAGPQLWTQVRTVAPGGAGNCARNRPPAAARPRPKPRLAVRTRTPPHRGQRGTKGTAGTAGTGTVGGRDCRSRPIRSGAWL
ncbi:hypothetical protein Sm713_10020 [Streptomyces sp. TS71-3]|nr:hypothetical protein Sm713_10020 [Streptomyces sp. TS71-3]